MSMLRKLLALGAVLSMTVALSACGGGVSDDSVAKVGDVDISKEMFEHLATVTARQQAGAAIGAAGAPATLGVPPDFKACVAAKKKAAPEPEKGQPNPSDSSYKALCKKEYEALRDGVLQLLINGEWIQGEAHDMGIKVTDEKVKDLLIDLKQQSFPSDSEFNTFLKQTGYTVEDLLYRVKINELTNKVRDKVIKGKDKVSEQQLRAYFDKHKKEFGQPAARDVRIVLTKTKTQAEKAKAALLAGQSFKKVAKQYSTDDTSKNNGGLIAGITSGQLEKELDAEVFAAKKNVVGGPVKTQFGYYVYEVTKITKPTQQSYEQVKESIKSIVSSQQQQDALNKFVEEFTKKWTEKTDCASGFDKITECKNGPKTTSTAAGVAPGAVPQTTTPAQ